MAEPEIIEFGTNSPILTNPSPDVAPIEFDGEAGSFAARAGASIPTTTEGKVQFLERMLGEGNVKTTPRGEILIADPETGSFAPFDERGISVKDVTADLVGPAIEAIPGVVGGVIGTAGGAAGSVGGAAAGGALGAAARIGAAEILTGGETGQTLGEQAVDIGVSALLSAGAQGVSNLGARVFDALRPGNFVKRQVAKTLSTPFAKKGARLKKKTGIPQTLGEETGSRGTLMVESLGRRTPAAADTFFEFHQTQLKTAMSKLDDVMNTVRPAGKVGSFQAGDEVVKAYDEALDTAMTLRRKQADMDFGDVTRLSGGQPVVNTKNTVTEIQQVVDELDVPGAGDATASVVNKSKKLMKTLIDDDGPVTLSAEKIQRLLQVYTNAQRGTGALFKDMEKAQSRLVAGRLKDALLKDLDDAAEASTRGADIATALRLARDRYRVNSAAINEIGDNVLSRLIGNGIRSPEAIADAIVTRLKPSEVTAAMGILERAAPTAAQSVRRRFIENAIERARPAMSDQTASGAKFSAAKFLSNLPDLDTMKAAGFSRVETVEIGSIAKSLERVADKAFEGSPTAFVGITWDAIRGMFTLNPVTLGRAAGAVLTPRKIAKATLTPEGRKALTVLTTTGNTPKAVMQATMNLTAVISTEPGAENVRPLEPLTDDTQTTLDQELETLDE